MNRMRERVRFNKGLYAWMGFRSVGVPFHVPPRSSGVSRWRPRQLLRFALDGITTVHDHPAAGVVLPRPDHLAVRLRATPWPCCSRRSSTASSVPGFPTLIISVMFFRRRAAHLAGRHRRVSRPRVRGGQGPPAVPRGRRAWAGTRSAHRAESRARGRRSGTQPGMMARDDHPLRRRLCLDRGRLARHRRAGRCAAAVGHQRDGHHAALAGDGAAPARAPRPPGHRPASQSDARPPARAHAAAGAGRQVSRTQRAHPPGPARHRQLATRSPARSSASSSFEKGLGFPPDHIDGHEHMHVLSGHPQPLLDVVSRRYPGAKPLIRDPSDRWQAIAARRASPRAKAAVVGALALGFAAAAQRKGLPTNEGFSGLLALRPRDALRPGVRATPWLHPARVTSSCATPGIRMQSLPSSTRWSTGGAWSMTR